MGRVKTCPWCGSLEVFSRGDQFMCGRCKRQFRRASHIDESYAEVPLSIFLSYGHEDEELVSLVRERLELRGHEVFFDRVKIKPGDEWRSKLMRSIVTSDRFVAFLSSHAFRENGVCREELRIAEAVRGGNIQVVLLQPEETMDMPSSLTDLQWIDCVGWKTELDRGGAAFRKWFDVRMDEIIRMVESDESARLEDEMRFLDQRLNASQGDSRRLSLQEKPFYGRRWLDEQVDRWLNDDNAPPCMRHSGAAGTGKERLRGASVELGLDALWESRGKCVLREESGRALRYGERNPHAGLRAREEDAPVPRGAVRDPESSRQPQSAKQQLLV